MSVILVTLKVRISASSLTLYYPAPFHPAHKRLSLLSARRLTIPNPGTHLDNAMLRDSTHTFGGASNAVTKDGKLLHLSKLLEQGDQVLFCEQARHLADEQLQTFRNFCGRRRWGIGGFCFFRIHFFLVCFSLGATNENTICFQFLCRRAMWKVLTGYRCD